jgi:predicted permease
VRELWRRIDALLRRRSLDRDLEEELRFHLDMKERETGSRAQATRALGSALLVREHAREAWGWRWVDDVLWDIRYALRQFWRNPGFTSVTVLSLAIGIGANCAIFSFADALLLRPLPVARPGDVFTVGSRSSLEALNATSLVSSYRDYVDISDRSQTFGGLAAFAYLTAGFASDPTATPKLSMGMLVSGNLLPLMGVEPTIGRSFRPEEDQVPGRDAVVVLGRALWERAFASDVRALGRTVRINGVPFTVIGVAPEAFTSMNPSLRADFFAPLMMSSRLINDPKTGSLEARDARNLTLKGRLKRGTRQAQAQAELTRIAADLQRAYPETNRHRDFLVRTELQSRMAEDPLDAMMIAMLSTLAIAVLLVACGNVAGLLVSRAPERAREMALRLAIGAGRARLVRQLITESVLLAIAGGLLGLGIGYAGMRLFSQIEFPTDLPMMLALWMDRRALLFSLGLAFVSALIFGLVPAIQASRTDLNAVMKAGEALAPGRRRRWGRAALVAAQVAVSVVVLAVALFIYRGFSRELTGGPGYRIDQLLMMRFDPRLVHYSEPQSRLFFQQVADRARAVTGVKTVTMTSSIPMANGSFGTVTIAPEGFQFPPGQESVTTLASMVDEDYFDTMGIPLLAGRSITRRDDTDAPRVGIVNQHLAQHYWPNQDPLGKRFRLKDEDDAWVEVVGVVKTSKYVFFAEPPSDFVYLPYRQNKAQAMTLLAQFTSDPSAITAALRQVVRGVDVNMPTFDTRTMEELYRMRATSLFNILITTVGALGLMGLGLSIVGLYGLVAYAAGRRTREIGIRMAIGATTRSVLRMVLQQGIALALTGLVAGLAGSIGAGRLLRAAFPTVGDQRDVMALVLVAPAVLIVTVLAAYIPARRASRVNPTQVLRYE